MPGASRANLRTRVISLLTLGSSAVVYSTHVTWEPRTPPQRRGRGPKISQKQSEGMMFPTWCTTTLTRLASYHIDLNMDTVVTSVRDLFVFVTGARPRFRAHGGTAAENLALQNIQVEPIHVASLWHVYKPATRLGCVWFLHIYLRNFSLGLEADKADCSYWEAPM